VFWYGFLKCFAQSDFLCREPAGPGIGAGRLIVYFNLEFFFLKKKR
jgi:hypothetical protein